VSYTVRPIPKRELLAYQADLKGTIFRQIREAFSRLKKNGFTQKDLAIKIGMNEGQLSRRLRGDYDLRLETLSDLARGLDCRIDVRVAPLSFAVDPVGPTAVEESTAAVETSRWEKYADIVRSEISKERPLKGLREFTIELSKPFARRLCPKDRRTLRSERWFRKGLIPEDHIYPNTKKSLGKPKSYRFWKE
jgi:transcriptional regulator with XRE-family HTH domain